jgi:acid phosphatase type 7
LCKNLLSFQPCISLLRTWAILALPFAFVVITAHALEQARETIIDFDASWRYHDGDLDLGTEWRDPDFDDSAWREGNGILGYDTGNRLSMWPEPGLQTELQEGLITYYFRKAFDYEGPIENQTLFISQIIDDGAVYYLNGEEIARSALIPEGDAGFGTRATAATNPWAPHDTLAIENAPLRAGRNLLAVSVHNNAAGSSDIAFAMRLSIEEETERPLALYLTWQRDPTTTMTIQWHTRGDTGEASLEHGPLGSEDLTRIQAQSHPMVFSDRTIHTVELTGLEPDSEHRFRLNNVTREMNSPFYKLRTMPATAHRPIRVAVGGDVLHQAAWMEEVNRHAMRYDPDFIVWGGDLAYSDGREDRVQREYTFFEVMMNTLIADDGRVVPVLMGIGNHEIRGGFYWGHDRGREAYEDTNEFRESIAPYYYNLFAFPGHPGYDVLDFGDYMSLIFLDSDHSGPVEGTQTEWLEETLSSREGMRHLFPVYHVPAYPSVRNVDGATSQRIRQHWHPLFERYGVQVAFENHDHAYKRTVPIRQEQEHEDGIVFIGDGAWGVGERKVHVAEETWYLARSQSIRHLILMTLQEDFQDFKVISREGKLIDHYIPPLRRQRTGAE